MPLAKWVTLYVLRGFLLRLQCCQRKSVNLFAQTRLLAILNHTSFYQRRGYEKIKTADACRWLQLSFSPFIIELILSYVGQAKD